MTYQNLKDIFSSNFSLSTLGNDFSDRIALISLICHITEQLKSKKPDVTYYQVVYKLANNLITEDQIKGLAVICEDFGQRCKEFPTFGLDNKSILEKIKEILSNWLPF